MATMEEMLEQLAKEAAEGGGVLETPGRRALFERDPEEYLRRLAEATMLIEPNFLKVHYGTSAGNEIANGKLLNRHHDLCIGDVIFPVFKKGYFRVPNHQQPGIIMEFCNNDTFKQKDDGGHTMSKPDVHVAFLDEEMNEIFLTFAVDGRWIVRDQSMTELFHAQLLKHQK